MECDRIQAKGEVVLPKEWRDEPGIKKGDVVALLQQGDGPLKVIPPSE